MTTTDLAVPQQSGPLAPTAPEQVTAALEHWVGGMVASVRGAEYIVDTPMCPDAFWPLPPGVTSCKAPKQRIGNEDQDSYLARRKVAAYTLGSVVRYGLQLGLPPEVAVQGIFTVGGRMSMYAEQMVALVKSQGHGHRVVERTRERCVVEVCRRGTDEWHAYPFSLEDAVSAGYVPDQGPNAGDHGKWPDGKPKKSPGNAKYVADPAAMLYARASSIACRTEFPDVLRGLVTYEEVQDEQRSAPVEVHAEVIEPSRPVRDRASAVLAAALPASVAPPVEAGAVAAQEPTSGPAAEAPVEPQLTLPVSKGQLDRIKALFEGLGMGGRAAAVRADRMAVLSHIVERQIDDPRQLDNGEASFVLDNLTAEAVDVALGRTAAPAPADEVPTAPAAAEHGGDVDPYADHDPTTGDDWPMDGAEAAAEGM